MAAPKILSGGRAIVKSTNGTTAPFLLGIFNSISYQVRYETTPIYVLGNYSPVDIVYNATEVVTISATAWRALDKGPYSVQGQMPLIQQLIDYGYLTLTIYDRTDENEPIAEIQKVLPTGYSTSISERQVGNMSIDFVGILVDDPSENKKNTMPTSPFNFQ